MKKGRLLYKCRLCGKIDDSWGVPDVRKAVDDIAYDWKHKPDRDLISVRMTERHYCEDRRYGIMDLIGGVVQE